MQGGLAWDKILKMVNESKAKRDPFAMMIGKLKLVILILEFHA